MQIEAIFENIAERIGKELSNASRSIYIAVAWFTNRELFELLVSKAKARVNVQLIISNDEINLNNRINFEQLNIGNSHSYLVGDGKSDLMHNKFCVIDENVVINGSYNWSYKAENNHENIIITKGDDSLADQFIAQFKQIRNTYYTQKEAETLPLDKVIKRLEILKNYVILEDDEDIERETNKLKIYAFEQQIAEIITCLKQNQFSQAIELIEKFIHKNHQLVLFNDVDIAALKLEIHYLEHQLNAFDNEKTELEKTLSLFQHQHTKELGDLISRLLHLRKLKFRDDPNKFKEAEQDEQEYQQQVETEEAKSILELDEEQKRELKRNFRKASQICHPDKVSEEFHEMANEIFLRLHQAYNDNDLKLVNQILEDLEQGNLFKSRSETLSENNKLKAAHKISEEFKKITNEKFKNLRKANKESDLDYLDKILNELEESDFFKINSETDNDRLNEESQIRGEFKEMANRTFTKLRQAYNENNFEKVDEILTELEQGSFFKPRYETVNQKEKLKIAIQNLKAKIALLEQAIIEIKESEEYQTIIEIDDWDSYFAELKEQLTQEIANLEHLDHSF